MKRWLTLPTLCWCVFAIGLYGLLQLLIEIGVISVVWQITLANIGINVILAVSLNLILGISGQFSLGHAAFMGIGAYAGGIVLKMLPGYTGMLLGALAGLLISALAALVIAVPTLRLRGDYLAIATLGFGEIIRIIINNMKITNGAAGLSNIPAVANLTVIYFTIVLTLIIVCNFKNSAPGRACISIKEDEIASEAMGIPTTRYKVIAFVLGAMLASLAGVLYASSFYVIKPTYFAFAQSINILVIVVFGGMGSMTGSVVAALVLGVINYLLQSLPNERMIVYAVAIILIMVFRPKGLMGNFELSFARLKSLQDIKALPALWKDKILAVLARLKNKRQKEDA
ncbi:MAG: branched-chain amino acid ABC transporter permease [Erysipelotrichaceae bacterium]|jgi:branched-chain amino acid transport system permease protein|nr:branched-chain amino acid ABC transporter permease [Erysipelotrichaceae bacterium]